jgi:hypothetical protein
LAATKVLYLLYASGTVSGSAGGCLQERQRKSGLAAAQGFMEENA